MAIKIVISLKKSLFKQAEALAHELHISRSRLFVLALKDFIRRNQNQQLLEQINLAYDDLSDSVEQERLAKMRSQHRQIVEEW